jgi:multidrug transporter EmrE-like cation transporter
MAALHLPRVCILPFGYTAAVKLSLRNTALLLCYLVFVTSANVFLKLSAGAGTVWYFIIMQIAGNLAGFVGILAYTGLLQTLPLHIAFPISRGLVVLGVQLAASLLFFHEVFRPTEAVATALVTAGIILVGAGAPRQEKQA